MNPYREAFYQRQAEWHGYDKPGFAEEKHTQRVRYYDWYTRDWLPRDKDVPILDIACGSGQFLYFLRERGYTNAVGIDLDRAQVEIGRSLGLDCRCATVSDFLASEDPSKSYQLVTMLDILEHFTRDELFPILEAVAARLAPGGRLMVSVPNADSPHAARAIYADITHEIAFTPTSLNELFFCHGLKVAGMRDPWPAPVSPVLRAYRAMSTITRKMEGLRLRLLGFDSPQYWSSVVWALAEKPQAKLQAAGSGDRR
ncbi:class I SAM-dependent methyltransferase [Paludisphaera rhizosphaerae]|uniref:class I SAM-dependent methyltransferase n=1 Tax=Paludisphaera rhizosphaerae TaxID=2711216 RepID=UPI0013EBCB9D|nr:class I SAM-dependent methyltransferase [Paludisphaera rhizosphaerae]